MQYKVLAQQEFAHAHYKIVPIRYEDRIAIMQWRNEQIYHLRQQKPLTLADQENYFTNVVSGLFEQEQPNQILFSFLENDQCVGYGGLVHINWNDQHAEISFVMNTALEKTRFKQFWSIYLGLIEQVAFDCLKLHKIYTYAFDLRPHLYYTLEDNSYVKEAVLKEHCFFNGKFIDVVIHSKIKSMLRLRKVNANDAKILFDWANDPEVRGNAINRDLIVWENHLHWFDSKLKSKLCFMFICEVDGLPVGQIRLDLINGYHEIDYSIDQSARGNGYGKKIIQEVMRFFEHDNLKAIVKNSNVPSKKIFSSLGFKIEKQSNTFNVEYVTFTNQT